MHFQTSHIEPVSPVADPFAFTPEAFKSRASTSTGSHIQEPAS